MTTLEERVTRLEEQMVTKDYLKDCLDDLRTDLASRSDLTSMETRLRADFRKYSREQADRVLNAISTGTNPNH